jgi:hypothetical protein
VKQSFDNLLRQLTHEVSNLRAFLTMISFNGEERFRHRDRNLMWLEVGDNALSTQYFVLEKTTIRCRAFERLLEMGYNGCILGELTHGSSGIFALFLETKKPPGRDQEDS